MNYGKAEERSLLRHRSPSTARHAATSAILTDILSRSDRAPTSSTVDARAGKSILALTGGGSRRTGGRCPVWALANEVRPSCKAPCRGVDLSRKIIGLVRPTYTEDSNDFKNMSVSACPSCRKLFRRVDPVARRHSVDSSS